MRSMFTRLGRQDSVQPKDELNTSSTHSVQSTATTTTTRTLGNINSLIVRRSSYINGSNDTDTTTQSTTRTKRLDRSGIIAEKHPDTTVLFAGKVLLFLFSLTICDIHFLFCLYS
jgi:hypothetical protein